MKNPFKKQKDPEVCCMECKKCGGHKRSCSQHERNINKE